MTQRRPEHISQELLNWVAKSKLVGVHGACGSGKSVLAKELAVASGGTHIEVDNHLLEPRKPYLEQLNFEALKNQVEKSNAPIILDCFILMDVLEKIDVRVDLTIYCERENDEHIRFNQKKEAEFASYKTRRKPKGSAKAVFSLVFPSN